MTGRVAVRAPVLANRVFLWFGFRCYMRLLDVDLPSHTLVSGLAGDTRAILSQCALLFWALRDSSREANLADLGFSQTSCFLFQSGGFCFAHPDTVVPMPCLCDGKFGAADICTFLLG